MAAYYNEHNPFAANWLRELVKQKHLPDGEVDERSIEDVHPADLRTFTQCHFFAGIGGWPYALRLAGWPDNEPVWTGSCPCQPFSTAGKKAGFADERHLWPAFFHLITQCRPPILFGEQVEAAIKWGWLDTVYADLEGEGYACTATVLPACSVGAPHFRNRVWFVANTESTRRRRGRQVENAQDQEPRRSSTCLGNGPWLIEGPSCKTLNVADVLQPSYGVPGRVGRLRGYGNAIVPQVAATFIQVAMECIGA